MASKSTFVFTDTPLTEEYTICEQVLLCNTSSAPHFIGAFKFTNNTLGFICVSRDASGSRTNELFPLRLGGRFVAYKSTKDMTFGFGRYVFAVKCCGCGAVCRFDPMSMRDLTNIAATINAHHAQHTSPMHCLTFAQNERLGAASPVALLPQYVLTEIAKFL